MICNYLLGLFGIGITLLNLSTVCCIICYNCQNIGDLSICQEVIECQINETCYIERVLSPVSLKPVYNTGCRHIEFCRLESCNKAAYGNANHLERKEANDLTICSQCCYGDTCNSEGCGYKQPSHNITKCFKCDEVYEGGPQCTDTVDCDLTQYACSVTVARHSQHIAAYQLDCIYQKQKCAALVSLSNFQKDENVKCCDKPLCNANPYNRGTNMTTIAMNFQCPLDLVKATTVTTTPTATATLPKTVITTPFTISRPTRVTRPPLPPTTTTSTSRPTTVITTPTATTSTTSRPTTVTTTPTTTTTTTTTTSRPTTVTTTPTTSTTTTTTSRPTTVTTTPTTTTTTTTTSRPTTVTTTPTTTTTTTTTTSRPTTVTTTPTTTTSRPTTVTTTPTATATLPTTVTPTRVWYDISCSFEIDSCSWTQDQTDDFDWTLQHGPTQTDDTGPPVDHTLENDKGRYFYIETTSPRARGQTARLKSPVLSSKTPKCLSLWYYMYGSSIGDLSIILRKNSSGVTFETVLLKLSGDQGQLWTLAQIGVPASATPYNYTLIIEGTVGSSYHGDIAIDDVLLKEMDCKKLPDIPETIIG